MVSLNTAVCDKPVASQVTVDTADLALIPIGDKGFRLGWVTGEDEVIFTMEAEGVTDGWVSLGFGPMMADADMVVGFVGSRTPARHTRTKLLSSFDLDLLNQVAVRRPWSGTTTRSAKRRRPRTTRRSGRRPGSS